MKHQLAWWCVHCERAENNTPIIVIVSRLFRIFRVNKQKNLLEIFSKRSMLAKKNPIIHTINFFLIERSEEWEEKLLGSSLLNDFVPVSFVSSKSAVTTQYKPKKSAPAKRSRSRKLGSRKYKWSPIYLRMPACKMKMEMVRQRRCILSRKMAHCKIYFD